MSANLLQQSFAGGEITPELFGRVDLGKFQTGLALCRNFLVLPHGHVQNRPGFSYVNEARGGDQVRLIPFAFSADQTAIIELGNAYFRVHTNGGTVTEFPKTVAGLTWTNPAVLTVTAHGWSTDDVVYLASSSPAPRFYKITVLSANTFSLRGLDGAAIDATVTPIYALSVARVLTVTTTYQPSHLFDIHYTQSADVLTLTHPSYPAIEIRRVSATSWTKTTVSFAPTIAAPAGVTLTPSGSGGTPIAQGYVITALSGDGLEESLQSTGSSTSLDLTVAGNYIDVAPSAALPTGSARFNVYKQSQGLYGYIGQAAAGGSFRDDNITPDMTKTPPEGLISLNVAGPIPALDEYPSAVTYHEQRRWFAATNARPTNFWGTRSGTEANLTTSIPSQDDDAIAARVKASQQNRIRHLVPLSDMLALTAGGEFRIFSGDAPAITPTTLAIKPQGNAGASNVQPVMANNAVLYAQAQGSHLREMSYKQEAGGYTALDLSIMAPHLVDGFTIADMAFSKAPTPTVWVVRSDGRLLGMTYVPEHQVFAWHQHVTDGFFESVAVVAEGNEDVLYAVVRRNVGGRVVRYIERMASRVFATKADAFIVDCGLTYNGTATTTIGNLHHLEGKTVNILADGAVCTPRRVTAGTVTIDSPATKIHVGLPITADLESLPLAFQGTPATGQGKLKNVNAVYLRVYRATGMATGPSFDKLRPDMPRSTEPFGTAPALRSEMVKVAIAGSWNYDGSVCVRQTDPVPVTILSMALDVAA